MISIRLATAADCAFVQACAQLAYVKYIDRIGKAPAPMVADFAAQITAKKVIVAIDNAAPIAFAVCYPLGGDFHLENIAVAPDNQGGGVGRLLIEAVQLQAKQRGFDTVSLYTNEKMVENLDWYKGLGFIEISRRFEDGFNRAYFKKLL